MLICGNGAAMDYETVQSQAEPLSTITIMLFDGVYDGLAARLTVRFRHDRVYYT
jgi:hypothetical protein